MTHLPDPLADLLAQLAAEDFCYLTTTGRVSGKPHEIEIWFGIQQKTLYMLSGNRENSDWVRNIRAQPAVTVRIGKYHFRGVGRTVEVEAATPEDQMVRKLLADKYDEREADGSPDEWARTSLPMAVDLELG